MTRPWCRWCQGPAAPFQGWRYLEDKDVPADLARTKGAKDLPEALQRELAALGLL